MPRRRHTLVPYSTLGERTMDLKEHLQFLSMMIPTLLLLVALAATLAFPAG